MRDACKQRRLLITLVIDSNIFEMKKRRRLRIELIDASLAIFYVQKKEKILL